MKVAWIPAPPEHDEGDDKKSPQLLRFCDKNIMVNDQPQAQSEP